jgi:hypothetical protein
VGESKSRFRFKVGGAASERYGATVWPTNECETSSPLF